MENKYLIGIAALVIAIFGVNSVKPVYVTVDAPESNSGVYELGAIPGNVVGPEFCQSGICTYADVATVGKATSTIYSKKNMFNATTSVALKISNWQATSTVAITCGTSTSPSPVSTRGATPTMTATLINGIQVATDTEATILSGVPNTDWSVGSARFLTLGSSPSYREVIVGPTDYVICHASSTVTSWGDGTSGDVSIGWGVTDTGANATGTVKAIWTR